MSVSSPYFYVRGIPSWAPSQGDTEVQSLQKINGLLTSIANSGGGGGSGPQNSIQLIDAVTGYPWTLTMVNGQLEWN